MTDLEKSLLTSSVIMSYYTNEKTKAILKELQSEDTGHIGDEFQSRIIKNIQDYIESFVDDDNFSAEVFVNERILPQLEVCNYINIITEIEALEYRYMSKEV
jgi:hypothetical protein